MNAYCFRLFDYDLLTFITHIVIFRKLWLIVAKQLRTWLTGL